MIALNCYLWQFASMGGYQLESFLIVDDEPSLLARLCRILRSLCGEDATLHCAGSVTQAKAMATGRSFTMSLVDLGLPDGNGTELIQWLRARSDMPILVISAWSTEDAILDALRAGATGYLLKERDDEEIALLLRTALKGGMPIDPFIARRILSATSTVPMSLPIPRDDDAALSHDALSKREVQILELVAQGLSNLEIAEHTNLSRWTVATHVKSIYAKFAVHTRTAAVRAGRGSGILR